MLIAEAEERAITERDIGALGRALVCSTPIETRAQGREESYESAYSGPLKSKSMSTRSCHTTSESLRSPNALPCLGGQSLFPFNLRPLFPPSFLPFSQAQQEQFHMKRKQTQSSPRVSQQVKRLHTLRRESLSEKELQREV